MSKPHPFRGALCGLLATLSVASCGSDSNQADPFYGTIFTSDYTNPAQLDAKFIAANTAALCTNAALPSLNTNKTYPCYPLQLGYANGNKVWFYNFYGAGVKYSTLPNPLTASIADPAPLGGGGAHVDVFPHSCAPGDPFDPRLDAYATTSQFPIFNNLPFYTTAFGAIDYPVVATYGVSLTSNETCNDIKDDRSIADASSPGGGKFGATRTAQPTSYQLWAPIDMTAFVEGGDPNPADTATYSPFPGALNPNYKPQFGWYEGLLLKYLDGGPIPTKQVTNTDGTTSTVLVAMEGIIVDPSGSGFSTATANSVIILPAAPGDDAYSPIVNLHDYHLQSGQSIGSVTSICQPSDPHPCPASSADFTKATAAPFYTIFIASTPQQTQ